MPALSVGDRLEARGLARRHSNHNVCLDLRGASLLDPSKTTSLYKTVSAPQARGRARPHGSTQQSKSTRCISRTVM